MPLKRTLTAEEHGALPEAVRPHYTRDAETGQFQLDAEPDPALASGAERLKAVRAELVEAKAAAKAASKTAADAPELTRMSEQVRQMEAQIATLREEKRVAAEVVARKTLREQVAQVGAGLGMVRGAEDDLVSRASAAGFTVRDDVAVVIEDDAVKLKDGKPVTLAGWMNDMKFGVGKHLFETGRGGGDVFTQSAPGTRGKDVRVLLDTPNHEVSLDDLDKGIVHLQTTSALH